MSANAKDAATCAHEVACATPQAPKHIDSKSIEIKVGIAQQKVSPAEDAILAYGEAPQVVVSSRPVRTACIHDMKPAFVGRDDNIVGRVEPLPTNPIDHHSDRSVTFGSRDAA